MRKKRNLFDELMAGFDALIDQRAGKRTLRRHPVKAAPCDSAPMLPNLNSKERRLKLI
jgi:putative transcriptional regulator